MSFNLSTRLNNLYQVVENIQTTALTNPMVASLNMASYNVNNASSVNAPASTPLILSADPAQGVIINTKVSIPNHPLTITNNTTNDSFQVGDSAGDTNVFRIDSGGNVAVKSDPNASLTSDFTVNGNTAITGNLIANTITAVSVNAGNVLNNITAGTGILKTGTAQNPIISNSGVLSINSGNSGITIGGLASNPTISNTGLLGLQSSNAGTGISITGTTTNPLIALSNVGTAGNYTYPTAITTNAQGQITSITSGSTPITTPQIKLSLLGIGANSTFPISGGQLGYQSCVFYNNALYQDFVNGGSPDPNGVWVIDLTPLSLLLSGTSNTGVINVGMGNNIDSTVYYSPPPQTAQIVSPPATSGIINGRPIGCPPLIIKVSDVLATCPNMLNGLQRIMFQNTSADTLVCELYPFTAKCYYYPNGVQ